jgi:anti-sigma B factor antagonist
MRVGRRTAGDVLILELSGNITMMNCQSYRDEAIDILEQGQRKLALDFSRVEYVDSAALAALVEILQAARRHRAQVRFFSVPERVRSLMEITNLHRGFPLVADEASALEDM